MAQDRVEAVERALTILEAFDSPCEEFTLADLAQATGFYKSTLLRLLGSLERYDYVQRGEDGRYRLGHTPVRLARRHLPSRHLAAWVQPILDDLAHRSGETAALVDVATGQAECRLVSLPESRLRHELRPGERWPIEPDRPPALALPGGSMYCTPLSSGVGGLSLWLTLSGPSGRLSATRAEQWLERAAAELQRRPTEQHEGTPA
ncbi:helix-turn-helix domain-containing protein [Litchfieldella xinjiangensis]|uniref:helix-turn-helix domain-containing protein n=1 Tax=Litchfieldella xinjiangensis TaxID=1166948 RepID=UPI0005BC0CAD|nr:helix-turn-helix domain-containing protein [Halomonas xinjiangensis]